ncbi:hypothetical protein HMPREF9098_1849, partial [Kingella denitrificans ATCC 33394]
MFDQSHSLKSSLYNKNHDIRTDKSEMQVFKHHEFNVQAAFLYIKSMWAFIIRQKTSVHPSKCPKT